MAVCSATTALGPLGRSKSYVAPHITGGGVTKASRNPDDATKFLEFLSSQDAQGGYAAANHEYPLRGMGDDPVLNAWGTFKQATVAAERLGERNGEAAELMAANGWQ